MDESTPKPQNMDEYKKWLKEQQGCEVTSRDENYYEQITPRIKDILERSEAWKQLIENFREFNDEYLVRTGYQLLATQDVELHIKSWESFFLKTYRRNVIENKLWPGPPQEGWILPDNWFSKINDIVRTMVVVKYLDGVEFLVQKVKSHFEERDYECKASFKARTEGYYAAHLLTKQSFEVPKFNWDTERIDVWVEIHVVTQLQEVIRRLTHKHYQNRRVTESTDANWQWNYRSDEFAANYLGHILHYVEGMILDVRERQKKESR